MGRAGRLAGLGVWATLIAAPSAHAAVFDAGCTGTVGDTAALAAAIEQANTIGGSNVIRLASGCVYTLSKADNYWYGPNGLPPIASRLTIQGNGATIARDPKAAAFRLLFVGADPASEATLGYTSPGPGALTIEQLTLTHGFAVGGDSNGGGGGAGMGGAIFSQGAVTIIDSTITANKAVGGSSVDPGAGTGGGGIGTSSSGPNGGGFGPGSFGGAAGGAGFNALSPGGGGGGGFAAGEPGRASSEEIGLVGGKAGGPATGLGGAGGSTAEAGGPAGDGSGGGAGGTGSGSGKTGEGAGGPFGAGGGGAAFGSFIGGGGGGVGGGGGSSPGAGGGGGFGGGGAMGEEGTGGKGGFGGGGGGAGTFGKAGTAGASGFGGGFGKEKHGGGGAGMGGAIFNMQGSVSVLDTTIAGNEATGGADLTQDHGKGIAGAVFNLSGAITATGSTIAGNAASTSASEIYDLVYDANKPRTAAVTLRSTILAGGTGPFELANDKTEYIVPNTNSGTAPVDVSQFDLVTSMIAEFATAITGTPLSADPLLGPLQDNGGPTQTMAPAATGPAIDAGVASGAATDQRGQARTQDFAGLPNPSGGDGTDIGAVELQKACATQALLSEPCHALRISLAGSGHGTVSGAGLSCPALCNGSYGAATIVTLTPVAAAGSSFAGWSGACSGIGACKLAMAADRAVTATFAAAPMLTLKLSELKQSVSRWREGAKLARLSARRRTPVGTTFSFRLSLPATVRLGFLRRVAGVKAKGRCVAAGKSRPHGARCTRMVSAGSITLSGHAGLDRVSFAGRLTKARKLPRGSYSVSATASVVGHRATSRALQFTILG